MQDKDNKAEAEAADEDADDDDESFKTVVVRPAYKVHQPLCRTGSLPKFEKFLKNIVLPRFITIIPDVKSFLS